MILTNRKKGFAFPKPLHDLPSEIVPSSHPLGCEEEAPSILYARDTRRDRLLLFFAHHSAMVADLIRRVLRNSSECDKGFY